MRATRYVAVCGASLARALLAVAIVSAASAAAAQEQTPPPTPPTAPAAPATVPPPPPTNAEQTAASPSLTAADTRDRGNPFGNLNVYLPEGEFDIRVRKLIKNVLFEGQVNYKFVDGNISTFLRYKYYARNYTYKIGVFDTIEFQQSSRDFDRVRGGLLLLEYPVNYNSRFFSLVQMDGLSFGDVDNPDNNKNNVYTKIAWQFGTPFDERLNAIVGESRGRITPVLTAYRDIGPQKLGLAVALTQSLAASVGDYRYTKLESEALKRVNAIGNSFFFSRLHVGTVLNKKTITVGETEAGTVFSIPYYEYFRVGGRDALKGINDKVRGTDEIHLSNEYFVPVFTGKNYRFLAVDWNALYGIAYAGTGTVGFSRAVFAHPDNYAVDAGAGFEAGLSVRDYEVFMNLVYARTVRSRNDLKGSELRFSIRTSRF